MKIPVTLFISKEFSGDQIKEQEKSRKRDTCEEGKSVLRKKLLGNLIETKHAIKWVTLKENIPVDL